MKPIKLNKTEILIRYLASESTTTENKMVEQWIEEKQENLDYFLKVKKLWDEPNKNLDEKYHTEQVWKNLNLGMNKSKKSEKTRQLRINIAIAASLIFIIGLGFGFRYYSQNRVIEFSAFQNVRKITFPDQSKVWLNRNSKIIFAKNYKKNRELKLSGEAYFEVNPDSLHPFVIKTDDAIITVLGTKFNVKAYPGKSTEVVVTSGKVQLTKLGTSSEEENTIILAKEEKGISEGENESPVKTVSDNPNYMSWKTRDFVFDNTNIRDIVILANSVYDVNIEVDTANSKNCNLTGKFSCQSVDDMLNMLKFVLNVDVEKKYNRIKLKTKGC